MKKRLSAAVLCVCAILSIACKKEPVGPADVKMKLMVEDCSVNPGLTNGENLYVYGSDNKASKFTLSDVNGVIANASGTILQSTVYTAFYPLIAAPAWDGTQFTVKTKSMQSAAENGIVHGAACYAGVSSGNVLLLKNIMSFISFSGDFGKQQIKSIVMTANEDLSGTAFVTLEDGIPTAKIASNGSKSITLMGSSVMVSDKTYMFTVLPGKYTGVKLTVTTALGEKKVVEVGTVNAERNTVTPLAKINLPADVWEKDPEDFGGPYDFAAGKVTWSDGSAAAGIVVSDGFHCTQTGLDGKFKLNTSADTWYIYLSMPANAKIEAKNGCPDFFIRYDKMVRDYNFTLTKQAVENEFAIFAMADPQAHNAARSPQKKADTQRFLEEAVPALNMHINQQGIPCYGITLGDIVYSEGSRNSTGGMPTMKSHFSKVNMPVFQTMGNHDFTYLSSSKPLNTDATSSTFNLKVERDFENCFGPINYSFNRGKTHFVIMKDVFFDSNTDASSYHCAFTEEQWKWFQEDMSYVPSDVQVVLNVHIPVAGCTGTNNTHVMDVLNTIKTHPNSTIFSGHTHYYRGYPNVNSTGMFEHIHSAVCGQWWWSKIEGDGCPAGYHIYKFGTANIKDDYFVGFNEGMNMRDYQIRVYQGDLKCGGSYAYFQWPHTSSTLLINVFNGDSRWKVEVYEDGVLKGNASMMSNSKKTYSSVTNGETYLVPNTSNQDWWAIGLHIGYIGRGTTSTSYYTNMFHMWKYTLSNPSARIKVVATDPYGTKYECSDVITDGLSYPMMYRAW